MKQRRTLVPPPKRPVATGTEQPGAAKQSDAEKLKAAFALHQQGQLDQAEALYTAVLQSQPRNFNALQLLATIAVQRKNSAVAIELFDRALKINPDYAEAHNNRGNALLDLKRPEEALKSYRRALKIKPDYAEAHNNCGNALLKLERPEEALKSYCSALSLKPDYAEAYNNRGNALRDLKRPDDALKNYERALQLNQRYAEAFSNRGNILSTLKRADEALASYACALAINPDYAEAYSNRGNVLLDLKRHKEALASYDRAIAINPFHADAFGNRAIALRDLKRLEEALESYARALELDPASPFLYGDWLHTKMKLCDWNDLEKKIDLLADKIGNGDKATAPFGLLAMTERSSLHRKAAEIWVRSTHPASSLLPPIARRSRCGRIHIGYFSADFHNHATAYLMAELFELHDKSRFELTAFSFGPDTHDESRERLVAAFDRFIDVRQHADKDVAILARNMGIDIAVDLKGFTQDCRVGLFAMRAAPLQVNYLGYPGTMAAEYIDYLIADPTLIPDSHQQNYTEKIAYLPNSYQVNDSKRRIAERVFTREEMGLPQTGFVFCCFNNSYKITPGTFYRWMRILNQVEGSVLWLLEDTATAAMNLRKEAALRGVAPARLIFATRMSLPDHLARHRLADLFIDTLPYNAHTTASDALWAGLPVLTCLGSSFAGRVAASLLNAIRLPELITATPEAYEALAIELATNRERLKDIKQKLAHNRLVTPLFDSRLFARHICKAYTEMYKRYQANLAPDHIHVPA